MPVFRYGTIRPELFLQSYYVSLDTVEKSPAQMRKDLAAKAEEFGLRRAETYILYRHLLTLKKEFKEDDTDE
ncbi:hypothetical protein [Syntrophomonas palmitatica]|uniref:hypothetical protein n=1 Tax=Syntrophomonas palmitatica TaxID=402877 RepID=UPI0006D1FD2F|nr:hypothetical protein [Syntrophomonas palmitatica]